MQRINGIWQSLKVARIKTSERQRNVQQYRSFELECSKNIRCIFDENVTCDGARVNVIYEANYSTHRVSKKHFNWFHKLTMKSEIAVRRNVHIT